METERPSPRFRDIELWQPGDILDAMIAGQFGAVAAVQAALPTLEQAALALEARLRTPEGRLIYAGAGTSGRLAVQDGAELMPTFGWPRDRLLLLIAGGEEAMLRAVEGAEDEVGYAHELAAAHEIGPADALVAVAASGSTPFTLACVREANRRGALTIGIANNAGTPLLQDAQYPILLASGAEPIAGSTRMNAGTAQRVTLSLLSTLVMIRLGRVYRGMMVDVQATNQKLLKRKRRMLALLTDQPDAAIAEALERADGSVKLAVLILQGATPARAAELLSVSGGDLRKAVQDFEGRSL